MNWHKEIQFCVPIIPPNLNVASPEQLLELKDSTRIETKLKQMLNITTTTMLKVLRIAIMKYLGIGNGRNLHTCHPRG